VTVKNDRFLETARYTCSRGNEYGPNNRVAVGNGVFLHGPCRDVISKGQSRLLGSSVPEAVNKIVARVLI
jgi:hypothetical protein